jgi:hypothetical protein
MGLEWLVYGFPPRMPQWLIFNQFNPPSWLTPIVTAPLVAMAWAFVLADICDRNPHRGTVTVLNVRHGWIRFELSPAILLGAAVLAVTALLDGLLGFARAKLFVAAYPLFEGRSDVFDVWAYFAMALHTLALSVVAAWTFPIAAQVLRTGMFDGARLRSLMRGNRLRLIAIFLLLNVALYQLDVFMRPAIRWIVRSLVDRPVWTLGEATIRHVLEFPYDMFWIVAWAVTMGIVIDALATPTPAAELGRSVTRAA